MMYKDNLELDELLDFIEKFVGVQLDDFHNWCDDISLAMYEQEEQQQSENDPS